MLQTPFREDGSIDLASLAAEVEFVISAGCDAVVFPGFASEWWKLSDAETAACSGAIITTAGKRVRVILNVTAQSTCLAVQQANYFASIGTDVLMCLPPFVVLEYRAH